MEDYRSATENCEEHPQEAKFWKSKESRLAIRDDMIQIIAVFLKISSSATHFTLREDMFGICRNHVSL
jgi:hypothetical protein